MMINTRLLRLVDNSRKYVFISVALQWTALLANIAMMAAITRLIGLLFFGSTSLLDFLLTAAAAVLTIIIRFICTTRASRISYLSSKAVKKTLREKIYAKLLDLGTAYREEVKTSEVVQVAVEGVDQLDSYFAAYLPQFFYAILAPLTLFIVLSFVSFTSALVLLLCVPLIPVAIAAVQTWAKKLLAKYWGQYTSLGDTFLENLQGLTTLKIYQADGFKSRQMQEESEKFRKITMKVLSMQLNSITIMDLIAYGGAALGVIMAVTQFGAGNISLPGCLFIILLSSEFFIPMRLLGSFFHIAMNGMAASEKIFQLLDLPTPAKISARPPDEGILKCQNLSFRYEKHRPILCGLDMVFPRRSLTAIVGESGCGKSTVAGIFTGRNKGYTGQVTMGGQELSGLSEAGLLRHITYIGHDSYLFTGTVRHNLLMGRPDASDQELWNVLARVNLAAFLKQEQGLDTVLQERAANLSGGQRQRLALARALLHNSPCYIFDEATSNIDVESENDIMREIHRLAKYKTVLLISHRLANVVGADHIYVMQQGHIVESGTHAMLLKNQSVYADLWHAQQSLEQYARNEVVA